MLDLEQLLDDGGLFRGVFGLEKENLRINRAGQLSQRHHPSALGDKNKHPFITIDFSESQLELITPPLASLDQALGYLATLDELVTDNLEDGELLWTQSSPADLPDEQDITPAILTDPDAAAYRAYLCERYGKKRQLFCGIHFNFSFTDKDLHRLYTQHTALGADLDYDAFTEQLYLKIARNFLRYRWVLIALLGASPAIHKTYSQECICSLEKVGMDYHGFAESVSMRNGFCGYRNDTHMNLDYSSFASYNHSIQEHIDNGIINYTRENYSPIRLKSTDDTTINHLEIRLLDLNPLVKGGIDPTHAHMVHLFLVFCALLTESTDFDDNQQSIARKNHMKAADFGLNPRTQITQTDGSQKNLDHSLTDFFTLLQQTVAHHPLPPPLTASLTDFAQLITDPSARPASQIKQGIAKLGFINWHLEQNKQHSNALQQHFQFHGLQDMELSTQIVLREAVLRGVSFQILDRKGNVVKLSQEDNTQYIKQATQTALDTQIAVLIMENKSVTKKVLRTAQLSVPDGEEYHHPHTALQDFSHYHKQAIVIKPQSTNFGLGITMIKENTDKTLYQQALDIAFEHDDTVLIEQWITGKEYRFLIIENNIVGILHRVPANVVGDGTSSISELVTLKNQDPLRGIGYKTPLEKIALGKAELLFLKQQNKDFNTIPPLEQTVYLRENSNISTGGDSWDYTDKIHPSYKHIALQAAQTLQVNITGLDMIITDIDQVATPTNHSIIEMNFNPAIHIHDYPYHGSHRGAGKAVLNALGF